MSGSPSYFQDEANAYDRAGFGGAAAFLGTNFGDGPFADMAKNINKLVQDPADRFAVYVDAICRSLKGREGVMISEDDIIAMLMKIRRLQYIEKKNATSYVLGYIASSGGTRLDKKIIARTITQTLGYSRDSSVLPADVIRYARLWMTLG